MRKYKSILDTVSSINSGTGFIIKSNYMVMIGILEKVWWRNLVCLNAGFFKVIFNV